MLSVNYYTSHKPKLTCNRGTSLNSGRELTEAMVTSCSFCKPEPVRAMTVNLRILTGSSQNHRRKRLNLRLWNLVSPPRKEPSSIGAGSHRPQHAVVKLLMCPVSIGGRSFPSTSAKMCCISKSQRELTCSLRTSLSSGRNFNSCKLDSVQAMTVNLKILTGSSQNHRRKRLNLRLWNLVSPPKKESVSSGAGSHRPQHAANPLRL